MKYRICSVLTCFILFSAVTGSASSMVEYEDTFVIENQSLKVELDIDAAEITVRSHSTANQCRVYVRYSKENCDTDVRFNPTHSTLYVSTDSNFWEMRNEHEKGQHAPYVLIELPTDVEIELEARIKAGEIEFKFEEIQLTEFELRNWAGETTIEFLEPNGSIMKSFDVNCKVGEVELLKLGNARFEEADINSGIGELTLDFSGDLLEKVMARIDLDIGETEINVPKDIGTKLRVSKSFFIAEVNISDWFDNQGRYHYSKNYRTAEKSLYLIITTGLGECSITSL